MQEAEVLLRSMLIEDENWTKEDALKLLKILEYLPLAITQAAAFISENRISVAEYINIFRIDDSELTSLFNHNLPDHRRDMEASNSVIQTWKLTFDQIERQQPRAAHMLSLMAVLDRQGIPKSLLRNDSERESDFVAALGTLQAFSLITAERGGKTFVLHRLVQLFTQSWLELQNAKEAFQIKALELLSRKFPDGQFENWTICQALLPHAQIILDYVYISDISLVHRATLLYSLSCYQLEQGRYNIAYQNSNKSYIERQKLLDKNDSKIINSLGLMASVLGRQGKYEEAEAMHRQTLKLTKKMLGEEHPNTLRSMNNLALVLYSQGKYGEAEAMHRQTLELSKKTLGEKHPDTLTSMNNLASVLDSQGKYGEAEAMHRQTLELRKKTLGENHPGTLRSVHNLACVLQGQEQYFESSALYSRAYEGFRNTLGPNHTTTLACLKHYTSIPRALE
jgi:tetratricopeptide (TPR) repeat protein